MDALDPLGQLWGSFVLIIGALLGMGFYLGSLWGMDRERAKRETSR